MLKLKLNNSILNNSISTFTTLSSTTISPLSLSLLDISSQLKSQSITSENICKSALSQISNNKNLNSYISLNNNIVNDSILSDKRYNNNKPLSILDGIPISIKDNFLIENYITTAGSNTLKGFNSPYNSTVTQKLLNSGAIIIGKTNLDEFAMGNTTTSSIFGKTYNPWSTLGNTDLIVGGSSGGACSSVASYTCYAGIGSDTGGSIRQPASYCGVVGLKPSYGRVSRYGLIAYASSLDCPAITARSVRDTAAILSVIEGADKHDPTSFNTSPVTIPDPNNTSLKGLVVGIPKEYYIKEMSPAMTKAWSDGIDMLKQAGAKIVWVSLPFTKLALPSYYIIAPGEASSNLAKYDGLRYGYCQTSNYASLSKMYADNRSAGFGPEVQRRILVGSFVLSSRAFASYFLKAQSVRRLIANEFTSAFENVNCILTPTVANAGLSFEDLKNQTLLDGYMDDIMTVPANLAGLPAINVPIGRTQPPSPWSKPNSVPIGLQLIGRSFDESTLLKVAYSLEQSAKFQALPYQEKY